MSTSAATISIPILTRQVGRPDRRLVESMDKAAMALHAMERLADISSDILDGVQEGEPYEVLVRRLVNLDENLRSLSHLARQARVSAVSTVDEQLKTQAQGEA